MSNSLSPDPNQNLLPSTSFSALNWNPQEPNPAVILQSDLLIGHINQNPNIPAVTPNPSDSLLLAPIEGSIATIDPNITLPNDNSFDGLTGEAMDIVKEQLTQFAKVPNFVEKMNLAFGESWDTQAANVLTQDWLNGDFSLIPPVKFVSSAEIGGANGAFASATDTIYLSRELLTGNGANPATVADVLLEEIGHSVDSRLNVTDAPGDEGAIFGAVLQDKVLSEGELQGLRGEDDRGTFIFNGQAISIEKAFDWGNNWGVQSWNRNGNSKSWEPVLWSGNNALGFGSNTRSDGRKGFAKDWGNGSPANGVNQDDFYLRFWTQADFQQGGTYNFNVKADDKYALLAFPVGATNANQIEWIGGNQLKGDAFEGKTIQFTPKNSGKYWVLADYREIANTAYFDLSWEKVNSNNYISGLSSLTDGQWDQQSGDGYYFDDILGNASQDASSDLKQVSKDLSTALLGEPFYMSTGYAYDTASIYDGNTVSHAGIDYSYDATIGETYTKILNKRVNAIVKGKVVNVQDYNGIGKFVTVEGEDKKLWLYGHIENSKQVGDEVNPGEEIGKVYNQGDNTHFHLEVHTPPFDNSIIDGINTTIPQESNLSFVINNTISPLQAYWQYRNNIK
ncbi:MAG TPA: M23 family metallopeptidase [Candidatus Obscuribacterales bacterium]